MSLLFQVTYCRRTWPQKLNFLLGDSEYLSRVVPKNSIDYLVDIESSFFYPNKGAFFEEVNKVLKEDGTFFYGTLVFSNKIDKIDYSLNRLFNIEHQEDITAGVIRSLKLDTNAVSRFIDKHYPWCKNF